MPLLIINRLSVTIRTSCHQCNVSQAKRSSAPTVDVPKQRLHQPQGGHPTDQQRQQEQPDHDPDSLQQHRQQLRPMPPHPNHPPFQRRVKQDLGMYADRSSQPPPAHPHAHPDQPNPPPRSDHQSRYSVLSRLPHGHLDAIQSTRHAFNRSDLRHADDATELFGVDRSTGFTSSGWLAKQGGRDTFSARPSTQLVLASRHTFRHLGTEDLGSLAVGRGDPRRVDAKGRRSSLTVAEAAGTVRRSTPAVSSLVAE